LLSRRRQEDAEDQFALGVFRGRHTFEGHYYLEVCLLMKCLDANVATHCEEGATTSTTFFDYFELSGSFNTTYIYPQVSQ